MTAQQWFEKGKYHKVLNHKVFVVDSSLFDPDYKNKPILCILHGFPTSSFDYWKVIDLLSEHYRVIVHDHLGFGFSDKPIKYSYSLIEQADIALQLWQRMEITTATLLAHDYGTSVLTEILARDNQGCCSINIEQIVLCNGSMHIELAQLKLMQKLLRNKVVGSMVAKLSNKNTLRRNLKNIYVDPNKIDEQEIDAIWQLMTFNQGKQVLAVISRYTFERTKFWHRWIGALQQTELPIEIIWPDKDPIAVAEMANVIKKETKNSRLYWLENLGHFPMLEDPEQWSEVVLESIKK